MKLVSIIVPVYNVEKYLEECVNSLLKQTYTNIEILLIDDGSTDNSGKMCDEFLMIDTRIIVYHKKNGGLSDARNYGIQHAQGDYIFFLDSDDYIHRDTINILVEKMTQFNVDICIANFCYYFNEHDVLDNDKYETELILNKEQVMEKLIQNKYLKNFAWGKLYKRSLIEGLLFPVNKYYEDIFWMHKVMDKANRVVLLTESLIYYRQREESISYSNTLQKIDLLEGYLFRREFIKEKYPNLLKTFDKSMYKVFKDIIFTIILKSKLNIKIKFYKFILKIRRSTSKYVFEDNKKDKRFMIKFLFLLYFPITNTLIYGFFKIFNRRIKNDC